MRADMFKVIVERPRHGTRYAPSVKLKQGRDQERKQIGLKRHAKEQARHWKSFNENLRPLERFLRSRRGRCWDDVFSEICAELDTGSTVKMHVRQHLGDLVMLDIGRGRFGDWLWRDTLIDGRHWYPGLCVDPRDGVLKDSAAFLARIGVVRRRGPVRSIWPKRGDCADLRWLGERLLLLRREDSWFVYDLDVRPAIDDVAIRGALLIGNWREDPGWTVRAHHQLSKRELKAHGLVAGGGRHD